MAQGIGQCPICTDSLADPCVLPACGHVFCTECINAHFSSPTGRQKKCPVCRRPMANQYPIKLFLDSGDNRPSSSLINSSSFATPSTSWAEATIPIPLFTIIHLKNLRAELASLQTEHTSVKSQLHAALNSKRIAERTVEELSVAQEQWRVQRDWLSRECEAHKSAAEERKSDLHALVAEVRSLRERVKRLSIDSKIIEPGSEGSNISGDSKVEQHDHISRILDTIPELNSASVPSLETSVSLALNSFSTPPFVKGTPLQSKATTEIERRCSTSDLPPLLSVMAHPGGTETCGVQYDLPVQTAVPSSAQTSDSVTGALPTKNLNFLPFPPRHRPEEVVVLDCFLRRFSASVVHSYLPTAFEATERVANVGIFEICLHNRPFEFQKAPISVESQSHNPAMSEGVAFCTICFEAVLNEGNGGCLKCGHVLHLDCLNLALKSGTDGRRCPICRQRSNQPPIRLFFHDLRAHSSPGASASPSRAKSSQDTPGHALALKRIHQLELDISSATSAYEHAHKIAQKARSAKAEAEHQVQRLSAERNDLLVDKDERIKSMNRLSDAYTAALGRVVDLEGQVSRATESLRDAQDEHANFADIKRIIWIKAKADLEAKDQTIRELESLLAVARSSSNHRSFRRPHMKYNVPNPEDFRDPLDDWETSGAVRSQAPDSPWSTSYGSSSMGGSSPGRRSCLPGMSSPFGRNRGSSSLELDPSMFITQRDPTEFGPPPSKRPRGGADSPSEVAGVRVRHGKAIGAVAIGPIRSRRLYSRI
ncbi:hypothetical protein BS47DRAFT_1386076 [Hydnum rufescens UP504]|uniref:RING-type domain-containing protein n=1 Tax=Hydnum rufescens UP504 TaxID=1448309 RepID=A0A9P6AGR4_9AGAM|nr:hypothetical protein BS47DRAFT_1386076 [Hydnum rufescens UP504]